MIDVLNTVFACCCFLPNSAFATNLLLRSAGLANGLPGCVPWLPALFGCRTPRCSWGGNSKHRPLAPDGGLRPHSFRHPPPFPLGLQSQGRSLLPTHDGAGSLCPRVRSSSRRGL